MKLSPGPARQADPRALPLPIDDELTADAVKTAPTSEAAWRMLGLPGDVDYTTELVAAANAVLPTGDAVAKGMVAFGALDKDAEVPPGWVDRMVTLYLAELEAFWALDAIAHESSKVHGWTTTPPAATPAVLKNRTGLNEWSDPVDSPAGRIAQRARWIAEEAIPPKPALWCDKILHLLEDTVAAEDVNGTRIAGRALVTACVHWRFTNWQSGRAT